MQHVVDRGRNDNGALIDDELRDRPAERIRADLLPALFGLPYAADEVYYDGDKDGYETRDCHRKHGAGAFKEYFHLFVVSWLGKGGVPAKASPACGGVLLIFRYNASLDQQITFGCSG